MTKPERTSIFALLGKCIAAIKPAETRSKTSLLVEIFDENGARIMMIDFYDHMVYDGNGNVFEDVVYGSNIE